MVGVPRARSNPLSSLRSGFTELAHEPGVDAVFARSGEDHAQGDEHKSQSITRVAPAAGDMA